jgi:hypothetical protein
LTAATVLIPRFELPSSPKRLAAGTDDPAALARLAFAFFRGHPSWTTDGGIAKQLGSARLGEPSQALGE